MEAGIHNDVRKNDSQMAKRQSSRSGIDAFRNSATSVSTHSVDRLPGSGE
jgi:hypothetical protein